MDTQRFGLTLALSIMISAFCCAQTSPAPGPSLTNSGIEGLITIAPTHPGPARPGIESSRPLANTTFAVTKQSGSVTEFTTDDQGHFKVSVAPGHYTVTKKEQQKIGRCGPFDVDVVAGQTTKVEWQCDTGMR